jgi:predicted porin
MGQNGTEFGRQAFMGLSSSEYGTLTFGRQYSTVYLAVGPITAVADWAAAASGFGAHPGDADNLDSSNRINNAVKYQSASYKGLSIGAECHLGYHHRICERPRQSGARLRVHQKSEFLVLGRQGQRQHHSQ